MFALIWLVGSVALFAAGDKPDDKLMQYVRSAQKAGDQQAQVEQKAIKAGWPEASVRDAISRVYGSPNGKPRSDGQSPAQTIVENRTASTAPPVPVGAAVAAASGPLPLTANTETQVAKSPAGDPKSGYEYRIGEGDVLAISVWQEPEASIPSVVVRPDGMISTPLTKEIRVAGLTPTEAENLIEEKLVKVIQEPNVTVVVTGMTSKKVYAVGAVKREGPIAYTYSMTVMQAIAEAGGLTDYAKRNRIYVMRAQNGKEQRLPFPYDDILKGKHMELNVSLLPGDTLVVPQ